MGGLLEASHTVSDKSLSEVPMMGQLAGVNASSAPCDLCKHHWLIVVGVGRSGSTTIKAMLRAIPQINMAGENHGVIRVVEGTVWSPHTLGGSWGHGDIDPGRLFCSAQEFLLANIGEDKTSALLDEQAHDQRLIGYKQLIDRIGSLDLVARVFPCARIVLNFRQNARAQYRASRRAFRTHHHVSWFQLAVDRMLQFHAEHPDRTFLLPLEEFTVDRFNELLAWIGVKGCTYGNVLHCNSGPRAGMYTDDQMEQLKMNGICRLPKYSPKYSEVTGTLG